MSIFLSTRNTPASEVSHRRPLRLSRNHFSHWPYLFDHLGRDGMSFAVDSTLGDYDDVQSLTHFALLFIKMNSSIFAVFKSVKA